MRYIPYILCLIVVLNVSCNHSIKSRSTNKYCDSAFIQNSKHWVAYYDTTDYLIKGAKLDSIKDDYHLIVEALNAGTSPLKLIIQKKTNDTLYLKIDSSYIFTQTLGTSGANAFLATTIFSLTENKGISCVYLDFEEGDHSGPPGYFTRKNFEKSYKIENCD